MDKEQSNIDMENGEYRTRHGSIVKIFNGRATINFDWYEEPDACYDCRVEPYPEDGNLIWHCDYCEGGSAELLKIDKILLKTAKEIFAKPNKTAKELAEGIDILYSGQKEINEDVRIFIEKEILEYAKQVRIMIAKKFNYKEGTIGYLNIVYYPENK